MIITVEHDPDFAELDALQQMSARRAAFFMNFCHQAGHVDLAKKRRLLDFGAGIGGTTFALLTLAKANAAQVHAVEINPEHAKRLESLPAMTGRQVHVQDGVTLLEKPPQNKKFDLVTAFLFGPDKSGGLSEAFVRAADHGLEPDGHILLDSDRPTMNFVMAACDRHGRRYEFIEGWSRPGQLVYPDKLVIFGPSS